MAYGSKHLTTEARELCVPVLVSFETGEQVTSLRLYPPTTSDWRLIGVRYEVVKALAATDAGTIDFKTAAGDAAVTQLSLAASTALGTRGSFTLSATDARLRAGAGQSNAYHALTAAKSTAGGKVMLWLYFRHIQPGSSQT